MVKGKKNHTVQSKKLTSVKKVSKNNQSKLNSLLKKKEVLSGLLKEYKNRYSKLLNERNYYSLAYSVNPKIISILATVLADVEYDVEMTKKPRSEMSPID